MIKVLEEDLIVWIDCEMTGLDLGKDHIVEIACIVTDKDLKILDEAPDIVINYPEEVIKSMNEWSWEHHSQSGLVDAIRESKVSLEEADTIISEFIGKHFPKKGSAILAGNSVHVDKKFLEKDFPKTFEYFHYRIIDVSTIKELTRRWYPDVFAKLPTFQNLHRALDDIKGSINELNYYRDMIFKHKI
ncbi:oligoribonuclease, mitochondrial-like protein, partial [Neocallimastix californiae]